MALKVLDFYKFPEKSDSNFFVPKLEDPSFCILVNRDGKTRRLILNLCGTYSCLKYPNIECFEDEAFRDYNILFNFLTESDKELIKKQLELTDRDYNSLLFQLYKVLVDNHSFYGFIKKKLLIVLGFLQFILEGKVEI